MPAPFPHHYEVALTWKDGDRSEISSGARPVLGGGPPPEFDGADATRWSPEHLILAALGQCLMLTWISLNKRSAIPLKSWDATTSSTLDKTREGLVFAALKIKVRLSTDAARVDEARRLLDAAKKHCIIANALKTPTEMEFEVVGA
jgi:organic hydroperoxide reductase OsmC/OhrA